MEITREIGSAVVTGPTGAVGTALCGELLERGAIVYAVCRPDSPRVAQVPEHPLLHMVFCDAGELGRLPELIDAPIDAFFHLAWRHTIGPGRDDMPKQIENIADTIAAVHAAAKLGCQVFLGAGSQAEYGRSEEILRPDTPCRPETGYGMAKLCAGQMSRVECEKLGMDHIWVRILSTYGPNDSPNTMISGLLRKLQHGEVPALTRGEQIWDYLYSGDAARALYLLARHGYGGKTYPLGSGQARPLREYIGEVRNLVAPGVPLGFGMVHYGPRQVMHLAADISELTRDTGFVPNTDFRTGILKTLKG